MKPSNPQRKTASRYGRHRRLKIESLEQRAMLSVNPIITEFLASNGEGLLDGNNNSSDWIELFNAGSTAVDLAGWHLTDDAEDKSQWEFPDVTESVLDPGEYLVVFASGDGVIDPAGNLHTNFALSAGGEYVALVMPDGTTVASEFGPSGTDYPQQFTDVSYGYVGSPLADDSPIQYYDADEAPGGNTTGLLGGWIPRGAAAGQGTSNFANEGGALQADPSASVAELATTVTGLEATGVYDIYAFFWDASASWNIQAGLESGLLTEYDAGSPEVFVIDATTQVAGSSKLVAGLNVLGQGSDTYDDWVDGNRKLYAALVGRVSGSTTATLYVDHNELRSGRTWYDGVGVRDTGLLVDGVSVADYLIPVDNALGTSWTANDFDASANGFTRGKAAIGYENSEVDNDSSYLPEILNPELPSGTTSTYHRTEFHIDDAAQISGLTLGLKYDDGFIAYLNGTEVLSRFAPAAPEFDSAAVATTRSDFDSLTYEEFTLTGFANLLVDGQNTLAIHALNLPNSSDFLMSPRLSSTTGTSDFSEVRYLGVPTPGAINGLGVAGFIGDTSFSVDRGFYTAPFSLDITSSTADAEIYYTVDGSLPTPSNPTALLVSGSILIDQTTTLRAAAFKDGFDPSNVDTQTYVFLEDVLLQDPLNVNGGGVTPNNGLSYSTIWQGSSNNVADYELDPRIVNSAAHDDSGGNLPTDLGIREALQALPTISITLDHDDLFGPLNSSNVGIATDATQRKRVPASFEYFDPNTGEEFQFNVGFQAHGNASRDNVRLKKHSFRLTFNSDFGPGTLRIPIFDNSAVDEINSVVLRASFTDAFATRTAPDRYNPIIATQARDVFMRDTQNEMGGLAPASTYSHLYINGLYWGLYNPAERPDDAFMVANVGGEREDWDIVRGFQGSVFRGNGNAWNNLQSIANTIGSSDNATADSLFQLIQGNNPDGTNDPNTEALLDADSLIDYMLLHIYGGVEDWPKGNWYAARDRVNPGKGFQFITWDQEISLDQLYRDRTEDVTGGSSSNSPGTLYLNLRNSPEFRLQFADRVQKHLFNDGALTIGANQARWSKWTDQMEPGIVGETARWGDAREGENITAFSMNGPPGTTPQISTGSLTVPAFTIEDWRESVDWVHDEYLVKAGDITIARLLADGLFTMTQAPTFAINGLAQHGGTISTGSNLAMATAAGTIYYTTDGSDPRSLSNATVGTEYVGQITLGTTTTVKARTLLGGQWSALSEATFTADDRAIVISEINYDPYEPTSAAELAIDGITNDDFEFIELLNTSSTDTFNLNGFQLSDGVSYTFGNVFLAPGERLLVVEDLEAFEARYGTGLKVVDQWSGGLNSGGETIQLLNGLGTQIVSVTYNNNEPWAISAAGTGATLVLDAPEATPSNQLGKHYRWRSSAEFGGTPGQAGSPLAGVLINEVLAHADLGEVDAIELYNPTEDDIDLGGWFLSDSAANLLKYEIPAGTMIAADRYLVFTETQTGLGLKSDLGDQVYLIQGNGVGGFGAFVDQIDFDGSFSGQTLGRAPNGSGRFAPLVANTLGGPNSHAKIGTLVISEVNFHPGEPSSAALAIDSAIIDNDLEFIEIYNPTNQAVDLTNWRLRGDNDYELPTNTMLEAGEALILVSFDPTNSVRANAFRTHYEISAGVNLVGGFSGNLSNGSARVELEQPDTPSLNNPNIIPQVTADEVLYDDLAPWPQAIVLAGEVREVDGGGASLERIGPTLFGNAASSWIAAAPTPGAVNFVPLLAGDYDRNGLVDHTDYQVWKTSYGSSLAINADGNGNGVVDAADYTVWRDNLGARLPVSLALREAPVATPVAAKPAASEIALASFLPTPERLLTGGLASAESLAENTVVSELPADNRLLLLALEKSAKSEAISALLVESPPELGNPRQTPDQTEPTLSIDSAIASLYGQLR